MATRSIEGYLRDLVAAGHGMISVKLSTKTGSLVATLIAHDKAGKPLPNPPSFYVDDQTFHLKAR